MPPRNKSNRRRGNVYCDEQCTPECISDGDYSYNYRIRLRIRKTFRKVKDKYTVKKIELKTKVLRYVGKRLSPEESKVQWNINGDINNLEDMIKYSDEYSYEPMQELQRCNSERYPIDRMSKNEAAIGLLRSVAESAYVPIPILEDLAEIDEDSVKIGVIRNMRTPAHILFKLAKNKMGNHDYEEQIVQHVNADEACFKLLIHSDNPWVRVTIINRTTDPDIIGLCFLDQHEGIKKAATNRYNELGFNKTEDD